MAKITKKPVIKVEEINEDAPTETSEDLSKSKPDTPTISSFSQLDSAPPAPAETQDEEKEESSKSILTETPQDKQNEESLEEKSAETDSPQKEKISSEEVKEWLKEVRPDTSKEVEKGRGPGGKTVLMIVLVLFLIGAVVGGIIYFQKGVGKNTSEEENSNQPSPTETQTPTPTEKEVDLTEISISILNGSGIAGEAGKIKDLLTSAGFSDEKIKTGNADSYDYESVSVSVKKDISASVTEKVETSLSEDYEVKISEDELGEDSTYDIVIIVGK